MTKKYTVKAPTKPVTEKFTSERSWGGKKILTQEPTTTEHGTMPPGWKHAESYEDTEGYVNCFCDGKLIARYQTEEAKSKARKEAKNDGTV